MSESIIKIVADVEHIGKNIKLITEKSFDSNISEEESTKLLTDLEALKKQFERLKKNSKK